MKTTMTLNTDTEFGGFFMSPETGIGDQSRLGNQHAATISRGDRSRLGNRTLNCRGKKKVRLG